LPPQVTSYSLSLREIDTVQDEDEAAGPDGGYVPNALEAVLRKRHLFMLQVWCCGWIACMHIECDG
jgi:hypothetical protein